jgi:diamine N-acetyltransferase
MLEAIIRKAVAEDYNPLCDLINETDALHRGNLPKVFREPDGPIREQDYYLGLIADDTVALFVAELDGKPIGFAHAILRDAPSVPIFVPRRYAVLDSIGVKLGFQDQGIGRLLMDTVHEWAMAKGAASIELNVYGFNKTARAFYEGLGYEILSYKMSKALSD